MANTGAGRLTLHEAMILALLEHKLEFGAARTTTVELEAKIRERDSYRQKNADYPDAAQVLLRARECPEWFELEGDAREASIALMPMKCGGA